MMGSLYNALITAKVPMDQAQKAAEEVAAFEGRSMSIEGQIGAVKSDIESKISAVKSDIAQLKGDIEGKIGEVKGDIVGVKVVLGIIAALQLMTTAAIISFVWRGVHL